jgi:hypothetical protein
MYLNRNIPHLRNIMSTPENFTLVITGLVETTAGFTKTWGLLSFDPDTNSLDWKQVDLESNRNGNYYFNLTTCESVTPANLVWIDASRNILSNQPPGSLNRYLAMINPNGGLPLPIQVDNGQFVPQDVTPSNKTLQLKVPPKLNMTWNDNRAGGYIRLVNDPKTLGTSIIDIIDVPIQQPRIVATPYVNGQLDPNLNSVFVGNTCVSNCSGKKCNEEDGCGTKCGCPPGQTCDQETGNCIKNPPCSADICGSNNGTCPGRCPSGQTCMRDANGYFKCIPQNWQYADLIILVVIILLTVIILILVIVYAVSGYGSYDRDMVRLITSTSV